MVSPIMFMVPPPAPWLSMAALQAELKQALENNSQAPASPIAQRQQADASTHKVDLEA